MNMEKKDLNRESDLNNNPEKETADELLSQEQQIEETLGKLTEEVEIPESLKPEHIEKLLEKETVRKRFAWKPAYGALAAAACCVIVIGAAAWGGMGKPKGESSVSKLPADKVTAEAADSKEQGSTRTKSKDHMVAAAKDYDEIYKYIEADQKNQKNQGGLFLNRDVEESAKADDRASAGNTTSAAEAQTMEGTSGSSYSDTNIREAGVEEGDIVKTDGRNLYIMSSQKVRIVNIENREMQEMGTIKVDDNQYISEIYVKDDRLVLIYTHTDYEDGKEGYGGNYKNYTTAETYTVSNPKKPESIGKITQSGNFNTMRVTDGYVYLISDFYVDTWNVKKDSQSSYIPEVQGKMMDSSSILMPQYMRGNQYTVISSFSLKKPDDKMDSKAVFGSTGLVYASGNNIYVCESYFNSDESDVTQTCIRKVSYKAGKLEAVGQTKINGTLNDSFSLDEYDGNLRLVTTVSATGNGSAVPIVAFGSPLTGEEATVQEDSNSLYVLDSDLNEIGKIEGLAEGERVYSARFMGDIGYFVTYKQVDPLFSVDLSNPKKPSIIGTLKIPGFSEYLHPYGEGLLLGIGMDMDETGTTSNGLKLSMFDTSNPSDVKESQKYVIDGIYSSDIFYNYKAVMISEEKNLFGFSAYGTGQHYYLFSYDKKGGFECILDRELNGYSDARGVYVKDTFYIVAGNTIESYDMESFDKLDDIVL